MKIVAIIPAYNEAEIIFRVVSKVREVVREVIVVDDGSNDDTSSLAIQAGAKVIRHFLNRGQGAALQTGIFFALNQGADIIITFDADGQHDPNDIERVVQPLLLGEVEVVLGSRFLKSKIHPFGFAQGASSKVERQNPKSKSNIPLVRKFILRMAVWFTRLYTGIAVTDTHNGFRAFSRQAAEKIKIKQDGMAHASEIIEQIKKHQLRFKEVPITIKYTDYSLKKGQRLTKAFAIVWDLIFGRISR